MLAQEFNYGVINKMAICTLCGIFVRADESHDCPELANYWAQIEAKTPKVTTPTAPACVVDCSEVEKLD